MADADRAAGVAGEQALELQQELERANARAQALEAAAAIALEMATEAAADASSAFSRANLSTNTATSDAVFAFAGPRTRARETAAAENPRTREPENPRATAAADGEGGGGGSDWDEDDGEGGEGRDDPLGEEAWALSLASVRTELAGATRRANALVTSLPLTDPNHAAVLAAVGAASPAAIAMLRAWARSAEASALSSSVRQWSAAVAALELEAATEAEKALRMSMAEAQVEVEEEAARGATVGLRAVLRQWQAGALSDALGRWRLGAAFQNTDAAISKRADQQIESESNTRGGPLASERARAELLGRKLRLLQQTAREQQAEIDLGAGRASAAAVRVTLAGCRATVLCSALHRWAIASHIGQSAFGQSAQTLAIEQSADSRAALSSQQGANGKQLDLQERGVSALRAWMRSAEASALSSSTRQWSAAVAALELEAATEAEGVHRMSMAEAQSELEAEAARGATVGLRAVFRQWQAGALAHALGQWRLGAAFKSADVKSANDVDNLPSEATSARAERARSKLRLLQQTAREQQAELVYAHETHRISATRAIFLSAISLRRSRALSTWRLAVLALKAMTAKANNNGSTLKTARAELEQETAKLVRERDEALATLAGAVASRGDLEAEALKLRRERDEALALKAQRDEAVFFKKEAEATAASEGQKDALALKSERDQALAAVEEAEETAAKALESEAKAVANAAEAEAKVLRTLRLRRELQEEAEAARDVAEADAARALEVGRELQALLDEAVAGREEAEERARAAEISAVMAAAGAAAAAAAAGHGAPGPRNATGRGPLVGASELASARAALAEAVDDRELLSNDFAELQARHEALKARYEEARASAALTKFSVRAFPKTLVQHGGRSAAGERAERAVLAPLRAALEAATAGAASRALSQWARTAALLNFARTVSDSLLSKAAGREAGAESASLRTELRVAHRRHEELSSELAAALARAVPLRPGAEVSLRNRKAEEYAQAQLRLRAERADVAAEDSRTAHARERISLESAAASARQARDAALDENARLAADAERLAQELTRARARSAVAGNPEAGENTQAKEAVSRADTESEKLRASLAELQAALATSTGQLVAAEAGRTTAEADAARSRARSEGLLLDAERSRIDVRIAAPGNRRRGLLALVIRLQALDDADCACCISAWRAASLRVHSGALRTDNALLISEYSALKMRLDEERVACRTAAEAAAGARAQTAVARDSAERLDAALAETYAMLREAQAKLEGAQERASRAEESRSESFRKAAELEGFLLRIDADRSTAQGQLERERRSLSADASQLRQQLTRAEERAARAEESAQLARVEARAENDRLRRDLADTYLEQTNTHNYARALPLSAASPPPPPQPSPLAAEQGWAVDHSRLSAEPFAAQYGLDPIALGDAYVHRLHYNENAESRRRALAAHNFSLELLNFSEKVL